jgi:hypothetical protein
MNRIPDDLFYLRFIISLTQGLIHKVVLLAHEVCTEKAVLTVPEVVTEPAVSYILTVVYPFTVIGLFHLEDFVAKLRVIDIGAIHDIGGTLVEFPIIAVLAVFRAVNQIAITTVGDSRGVFRVFILNRDNIRTRDYFLQFMELRKELLRKIKNSAMVESIPVIAPPLILSVDDSPAIGRVESD